MSEDAAPEAPVVERGDRAHWWRRLGTSKSGFRFVDEAGNRIKNREARERIKALAIPPAWTGVHISPRPGSRLQAIGYDGTGRAQYIYNPAFAARQQRRKYEKIERFGEYLPELRRITTEHLALEGLPAVRVLAAVTRLINSLYFRVGSEQGVERYRTYGVTTLRRRHLKILPGGQLRFNFDGKHHVHTRRLLVDESLARVLRELAGLPGPKLFKYLDEEGHVHSIRARTVNAYIKAATAPEFTAKDFRTWHGTLIVAQELAKIGKAEKERDLKRNIVRAVKNAAERLGNTPAVCRRAYAHPVVLEMYRRGVTLTDLPAEGEPIAAAQEGYHAAELALLELFQRGRLPKRAWVQPPVPTPVVAQPEVAPTAMPAAPVVPDGGLPPPS